MIGVGAGVDGRSVAGQWQVRGFLKGGVGGWPSKRHVAFLLRHMIASERIAVYHLWHQVPQTWARVEEQRVWQRPRDGEQGADSWWWWCG